MANADDLRSLANDMATAYKDRISRIKTVKEEVATLQRENQSENRTRADDVAKLLDDYDKAHAEMAAHLKATLAEVKPALAKDEADRVAQTQAEIKARADEMTKMLTEFDKTHAEMTAALKETLAEVRPTLAKSEADRKSQAVAEVKQRAGDVANMLDDYDKAHKEMAEALRAKLTTEEAERKSQTQAEIKARADEMAKMLAEFDKTHAEMAAHLKATLAEVGPTLATNEADRKSQAVAEVEQRAADVANMLGGFRRDQAETATAWQELIATVRSGREAKPLVVEKKALPEEVVEEIAVEKVREILAEKPIEKQVLSLINDNPQGIKLTEMEPILGVPRIKLGGITRSLLSADQIRKEGLLYFPKEEE